MRINTLSGLVVVGLLVFLTAAGCQALRKPDVGQGNRPAPTAPAPNVPLPTNPTESNRLAQSLVAEVINVQGVETAAVVLTGSTALVGVSLEPGTDAAAAKGQVGDVIKRSDNRIKNVLVTTDPELNRRIENISSGVARGRPIGAFTNEIRELLKRLSPSAS